MKAGGEEGLEYSKRGPTRMCWSPLICKKRSIVARPSLESDFAKRKSWRRDILL